MSKQQLTVTPEDYFDVLTAISASFLSTQPNYTHTLIFQNRLYVCSYNKEDQTLQIQNLDEKNFYKFLGEFAMFALESTLKILNVDEIVIHAETGFDYTVKLLPKDKLGIRKASRKE